MGIEKAIEMLRREYEDAKRREWIINPLAYALYEVWKRAHAQKGSKRE